MHAVITIKDVLCVLYYESRYLQEVGKVIV